MNTDGFMPKKYGGVKQVCKRCKFKNIIKEAIYSCCDVSEYYRLFHKTCPKCGGELEIIKLNLVEKLLSNGICQTLYLKKFP